MAYKRKIGLLRFLGLKNKNLGFFKAVFQPCLLLADLQQSMPFSLYISDFTHVKFFYITAIHT